MAAVRPLRDLSEVLRDGMTEGPRVLRLLSERPRSIPELASALGRPAREVTLWVMMLRRYGKVGEVPKGPTDEYYRYRSLEVAP